MGVVTSRLEKQDILSVQCSPVDTAYRTRIGTRIWRDTSTFIRHRSVPLGIAVTGLIILFWIRSRLHQPATWETILLTVASLVGSYVIWFLGALLIYTLLAPARLDADRRAQIATLEAQLGAADNELQSKRNNKAKHDLFGTLMQEAMKLSERIPFLNNDATFTFWDQQLDEWIRKVHSAIESLDFKTDAAEFLRSGQYAEPVRGVINSRSEQSKRRRKLTKHQQKLAEIVKHRLPG
jgi:small-conductance mechanosensitive channel